MLFINEPVLLRVTLEMEQKVQLPKRAPTFEFPKMVKFIISRFFTTAFVPILKMARLSLLLSMMKTLEMDKFCPLRVPVKSPLRVMKVVPLQSMLLLRRYTTLEFPV